MDRYTESLMPIMTSNENSEVKVACSAFYVGSSSWPSYLAFNNNNSNGWAVNANPLPKEGYHWLKIEFKIKNKCIQKIGLAGVNWHYSVKNFKVQGSNDDTKWDDIYTGNHKYGDNRLIEYKFYNDKFYKYYRILVLESYSDYNNKTYAGISKLEVMEKIGEFKYLIQQHGNYYSIKSNFQNIGQPIDNIELKNWYNKYGADDVNIITQNLNNKEFPMSKSENGIWKTDSELDINEVIDSIELVDIDENNKSIKYNCNDYRILDLCDDQFKLTMCKSK
ncbi:discoidin domain-containing protein [Clostridium botulinum]|uniref:discoidin domain-containing protein n=1 Tax=Clostridium botulinum TaxID=1491 RepID=UPI001F1CB0C3|nr:discoidin domain-containing protein [Clostridium botulinum]